MRFADQRIISVDRAVMTSTCLNFNLGAWIITGGMNTGIMKLVGEIVQINPDRSRPIHLIVSGPHERDWHLASLFRALERGAVYLDFNSWMSMGPMFTMPSHAAIRRAKRLSNPIIRNSSSSMMVVRENMAARSPFGLDLNRQYRVASLHRKPLRTRPRNIQVYRAPDRKSVV